MTDFSLGKFFLSGRFCTNECVCLNMDRVCSIDNYLSLNNQVLKSFEWNVRSLAKQISFFQSYIASYLCT